MQFSFINTLDINQIVQAIPKAVETSNVVISQIPGILQEAQIAAPQVRNKVQDIANQIKIMQTSNRVSEKIQSLSLILNDFAVITEGLNKLVDKLDGLVVPLADFVTVFDANAANEIRKVDVVIDEIKNSLRQIPIFEKQFADLATLIGSFGALTGQ